MVFPKEKKTYFEQKVHFSSPMQGENGYSSQATKMFDGLMD